MAKLWSKDSFGIGNSNDYVTVCLSEVRKLMQCPICLGIIRKTRTVMECLHRFCRDCIDKSMRLGNNECPACRTHCASRRSLRDDPKFDALIAALSPDLDKYEEEEMMLLEDETRRNRQIQASIAETFKRQSKAVERTTAKVKAAAIVRTAHGKFRNVQNRTRGPAQETRGSHNNRGNNNGPTGYGGPLSPQEEERELPQINPPSQKPPPSDVAVPGDKAAIKEQEVIKDVFQDGWRKRRRSRHVEPENSKEQRRATAPAVISPFSSDFETFARPILHLISKPFVECAEARSSLDRLTSEFEAYRLSAEQSVRALQAQVVEVASERDVLSSRVVELKKPFVECAEARLSLARLTSEFEAYRLSAEQSVRALQAQVVEVASERDVLSSVVVELQEHFFVATEEAKEFDVARSAALLEGAQLTSQVEILQQEVVTLKTELAEKSCSLDIMDRELANVRTIAADSMYYPAVLSHVRERLARLTPEESARIGLSTDLLLAAGLLGPAPFAKRILG